MSKAQLVITAVVHEQRPVSEVAAAYGLHRSWIYRLVARYHAEGEAAYQPRSRAPKTIRNAADPSTVELICQLRDPALAAGNGCRAAHHLLAPAAAGHDHLTGDRLAAPA